MTRTSCTETSRRRLLAILWSAVALGIISSPLATSTAAFTSTSSNPAAGVQAAADWTPPTLSFPAPDALRGTVALTANATDAETGVRQVVLAWSPATLGTWTTLCTDTAAPYTCSFNTVGLPEDDVDLRAVATDNAGYTTTVVVEGVLVDNVAPTASLGTIASTLSGVVTVPVNATDAGSGVASATVQYAPAGTTSWVTICTDTAAPWSCRFDTTVVPDGTYDLRAIVADVAGNVTTTALVRNRTIDNRASSVSMDAPRPFLRGVETLSATAFSNVGITSVRIQWQRAGTTTWTDVCTDTTSPYTCDWNTVGMADGDHHLRAVLLDGAGKTTTSATVTTRVDNSPVRGFDVQATNGATIGRLDAGDQLTVTYTRPIRPTSLLAGWDGSPRTVTLRLRDGSLLGLGSTDDTLDVFTSTTLQTPVQLGTVNLRGDYARNGRTVTIPATVSLQTVQVNGQPATAVVISVGPGPATKQKDLRTTSLVPAMVWSPSAAALDTDGIATSGAPVTELGTLDRDL